MNIVTSAVVSGEQVRDLLRQGSEIALVDVRPEGRFAAAHPLFAICIPLGRIEIAALDLIPRPDVLVVLYDNGEGFAERAGHVFRRLGYSDVRFLEGGLAGWREGGGELFQDVNVPSKAFGELVAETLHTPMLSAEEVQAGITSGRDQVILDARRVEEYRTMSIPTGRSLPGGELVLRARDAAPDRATPIVVNCAGRTRSIIGAQSLIHAGVPNPVFALRNGTIGWLLAGQTLEHGASLVAGPASPPARAAARQDAAKLAELVDVPTIDASVLAHWSADPSRTLYCLDVREPAEFEAGHLPGFRSAPGGQLVQAVDEWVGVRHARVVLADDDGVRARMAGFWLSQMGWDVSLLNADALRHKAGLETGPAPRRLPKLRPVPSMSVADLQQLLQTAQPTILDATLSTAHLRGHIPGARFVMPSDLPEALASAAANDLVVTCGTGMLARFVAAELCAGGYRAHWLEGGSKAWSDAGLPLEEGFDSAQALSKPDDIYKRPYEGTDNKQAAMQGYLDWEAGLVEQLARDGTHGFHVASRQAG
jgi:rhodanese-related sulfurtransferase